MLRGWTVERLIKWACVLALVGLALMVWSIISPRPIPVILAMSLGQAVGAAGLLLYLVAVVADLKKAGLLGGPPAAAADNPPEKPDSAAPKG